MSSSNKKFLLNFNRSVLLVTSKKWLGFSLVTWDLVKQKYFIKLVNQDLDVINAFPITNELVLILLSSLELIIYNLKTEEIEKLGIKVNNFKAISMSKQERFIIVTEDRELKVLTFKGEKFRIRTLVTKYPEFYAIELGDYILSSNTSRETNFYKKTPSGYKKLEQKEMFDNICSNRENKLLIGRQGTQFRIISIKSGKLNIEKISISGEDEIACPLSQNIIVTIPHSFNTRLNLLPLVKFYYGEYSFYYLFQGFKGNFVELGVNKIAIVGKNKIEFFKRNNKPEAKYKKEYEIEIPNFSEVEVPAQEELEQKMFKKEDESKFRSEEEEWENIRARNHDRRILYEKKLVEKIEEEGPKYYHYKLYSLLPLNEKQKKTITFLLKSTFLPKVLLSLTAEFI